MPDCLLYKLNQMRPNNNMEQDYNNNIKQDYALAREDQLQLLVWGNYWGNSFFYFVGPNPEA